MSIRITRVSKAMCATIEVSLGHIDRPLYGQYTFLLDPQLTGSRPRRANNIANRQDLLG